MLQNAAVSCRKLLVLKSFCRTIGVRLKLAVDSFLRRTTLGLVGFRNLHQVELTVDYADARHKVTGGYNGFAIKNAA